MVGYVKDDCGCVFSETIADITNKSPTGFDSKHPRRIFNAPAVPNRNLQSNGFINLAEFHRERVIDACSFLSKTFESTAS